MKILLVGNGGREHALSWKLKQSKKVGKIYFAKGNGGTKDLGKNLDIAPNDIEALLDFAIKENIDLTVVGPEEPLVLGIADRFREKGLNIFGVDKKCAQLEGSKEFSKRFMEKYDIPTAKYKHFNDLDRAIEGIKEFSYPLVIKADGLCAGKGVFICESEEIAKEVLEDILKNKIFGSEGASVVIEEFLDGIESSLLCFVTDGKIIPMESAKDYKKIFEDDLGPNTGGVGCYSPSPLFRKKFKEKIQEDILDKIIKGFKAEAMDFKGILFIGLMIVNGIPKVLEFNVRFGDPETEVLIPRLKSDLVELMEKTIDGSLEKEDVKWSEDHCVTVVATSKGYPGEYEKGIEITGVEKLDRSIILFHNGTDYRGDNLVTNGGRVLSITSLGKTKEEARNNIYKNIHKINFDGIYYRRDIGKK